MNVLLFGRDGKVGSVLLTALRAAGHDVTAVDVGDPFEAAEGVEVDSLPLDIDTPDDLEALQRRLAATHGGAAHTRDFEDVVAWLAQQMAFAPITRLLRVGWHTIGPIVARVVADQLDDRRLEGLVCIGVEKTCANCARSQQFV